MIFLPSYFSFFLLLQKEREREGERPICRLNRDEHSQLHGLPFENELPVRSPRTGTLWPSISSPRTSLSHALASVARPRLARLPST